MEKQSATRNTALTRAPRTSALAQPKVFLDQDLGAILTLRKAITRAAISDNMWKLSATSAMELVRYPEIGEINIVIRGKNSLLTNDNLHKEECCGEAEHADQPAFFAGELALPPAFPCPHLDALLLSNCDSPHNTALDALDTNCTGYEVLSQDLTYHIALARAGYNTILVTHNCPSIVKAV